MSKPNTNQFDPCFSAHEKKLRRRSRARDWYRYRLLRGAGFDSNTANRRSSDPVRRSAYLARHRQRMKAYREKWGRPDQNTVDRIWKDIAQEGINGKPAPRSEHFHRGLDPVEEFRKYQEGRKTRV